MPNFSDGLFIPSSYSRIVARELRLQERDLPKLLSRTGLSRDILLAGDETYLTGQQQLQILTNAHHMSGAAELGLRIGRHLQPSTHGPIGYLALSSPDLHTALKSLQNFLPGRIAFTRLELDLRQDYLRCTLHLELAAQPEVRRMILECFALSVQAVIEVVLGRSLTEGEVLFDYPPPTYHTVYRDYLHSPITFSSNDSEILLPAELASVPNTVADPETYAMAQALCSKLIKKVHHASLTMTDRVRYLLLFKPMGSVTEEDVAQDLFVSTRTLARRLKREGTGYRQIREELLAEMAATHLQESNLSVEAIAVLLGYHDSPNFRRAFRRWFQTTPSAFRGIRHELAPQ